MPYLAALLANGFAQLVGYLTAFFGKKLAVAGALAAFLVGGWVAIQGTLKAIWTGLAWSIPAEIVGPLQLAAYVMPSNLSACFSALIAARLARWVWDRQREWAVAVAQS